LFSSPTKSNINNKTLYNVRYIALRDVLSPLEALIIYNRV